MRSDDVKKSTGGTSRAVGHFLLVLVDYLYLAAAVSTRSGGLVGRLRDGHNTLRRRVTRARSLLGGAGGSINDRLGKLTTLAKRVRREGHCVVTVGGSIRTMNQRVTKLRQQLEKLRQSLGSGGGGCRSSMRCLCGGGSIRRGLVFVFSTGDLKRACHHLHCIERCTACRHLRKRRVLGGRRRIGHGGGRLRRIGITGRGLLHRQRNRGTGLRTRRGRGHRVITNLRGGRGKLRDRVDGGQHRTGRLGTGVSGLVTRRVRHTHGHTRRRTHQRTTTHQGTTTGRDGSSSAKNNAIPTGGGTRPLRHFAVDGTSHRLSNGFMDGENGLPVPVAKPCVVADRCKRCTIRKLHGMGLSGGKVSVRKGPNTRTHTVFSKGITTIFRLGKLFGMLVHRNSCVSMCYGLSSTSIGSNSAIAAQRTVNPVFSSNDSGKQAILRFRLHERESGLGPRP